MSLQVINTFGYEIPRVVVDTLFAPPDDTFTVPVELQTIPFFAIKSGDLWRWNTVTFIWEQITSGGAVTTIYTGDGTIADALRTISLNGNIVNFDSPLGTNLGIGEAQSYIAGRDATGGGNIGIVTASSSGVSGNVNLSAFFDGVAQQAQIQLDAIFGGSVINYTAGSHNFTGLVTLASLAGNGVGVVAVDNVGNLSFSAASSYTDEQAQDAVGGIVDTTLVYVDSTPVLKRAPITGDISIPDGSNTAAIEAGVIVNADINASAAIDATKIADGTVSNAEFQFINTLSSNAQTQLNNKSSLALDNLASVAINTSLISDTDNTDDLGSSSISWKDIYSRTIKLDGSTSGTAIITPPAVAGTPTLTLPITTGTLALTTDELYQYQLEAYQAMGSVIKAYSIGVDITSSTGTNNTLSDGQFRVMAIWLAQPATLTGVKFYQGVQGDYTADNNNKVGLYSYSGGTLTLVASSTTNATLFKAAANTFVTEPFSSTYAAARGLYFIGLLYNSSAQPTPPQIAGGPTMSNAAKSAVDFTNSTKAFAVLAAQTDLPASQAMSGMTASTTTSWAAVY